MSKYIIFAFEKYGQFTCNEIKQDNGDIHLIGSFSIENTEKYKLYKQYTLILNRKDINITN